MKKIIRLTESDLTRIVKRVIMEQSTNTEYITKNDNIITITKNADGSTGSTFKVPKNTKFKYVARPPQLIHLGNYIIGEYTDEKNIKVSVRLKPCVSNFEVVRSERMYYGVSENLSKALNNSLAKCS
jgi:hypothetical protein